jgi:hypothetical protein
LPDVQGKPMVNLWVVSLILSAFAASAGAALAEQACQARKKQTQKPHPL